MEDIPLIALASSSASGWSESDGDASTAATGPVSEPGLPGARMTPVKAPAPAPRATVSPVRAAC